VARVSSPLLDLLLEPGADPAEPGMAELVKLARGVRYRKKGASLAAPRGTSR
jgi:hypothetical protein